MEKYMAFMLGNHLTFIDGFQFMSLSLDKLINNMKKDDLHIKSVQRQKTRPNVKKRSLSL